MCFNWKALNDTKEELSLEKIEKLAKSLPDLFQIILSGGEPFLRNDLAEVVSILVRYTKPAVISIPTNAFSAAVIEKTVKAICKEHPNTLLRINISIDGIGKQHDDIRGLPGLYDKASETLERLQILKKDFPSLAVNVGTVLSKDNACNIEEVFDNIEGNLQPDIHSIGFPRGMLREKNSGDFSPSIYAKAVSHIQKHILCKRNRRYPFAYFAPTILGLISKTVISELEGRPWPVKCAAADKMIVVSEKGDVSPCEILGCLRKQKGSRANKELEHDSYGNLHDTDFDIKPILKSERALEVKKFIKARKCQCTFECAIFASLLFNPATYPLIIKETLQNWFEKRIA